MRWFRTSYQYRGAEETIEARSRPCSGRVNSPWQVTLDPATVITKREISIRHAKGREDARGRAVLKLTLGIDPTGPPKTLLYRIDKNQYEETHAPNRGGAPRLRLSIFEALQRTIQLMSRSAAAKSDRQDPANFSLARGTRRCSEAIQSVSS